MIEAGFLSGGEREELERCVRRQREDHGIARRANALLLLDDGKSCVQIAEFLYLDDDTIRGWYKAYRQDGWDALAHLTPGVQLACLRLTTPRVEQLRVNTMRPRNISNTRS